MGRVLPAGRKRGMVRMLAGWPRAAAVALLVVAFGIIITARMDLGQSRGQAADAGVELTPEEALDYALAHPDEFALLLGEVEGSGFVAPLFPAGAAGEWDENDLEQVLEGLSGELIDDFL